MRKTYHKPRLWYEVFRLSQSIASGCEGLENYAEGQCAVTVFTSDGSFSIEIFSVGGCEYTPP